MASSPQPSKVVVLNSWKEIASYLGRGVRTVQRYERDLGLPVRRPRGKSRSAVIAMPEDLDAWLRHAPIANAEQQAPPDHSCPLDGKQVLARVQLAMNRSAELRTVCHELREAHTRAMTAFYTNLSSLLKTIHGQPVGAPAREQRMNGSQAD